MSEPYGVRKPFSKFLKVKPSHRSGLVERLWLSHWRRVRPKSKYIKRFFGSGKRGRNRLIERQLSKMLKRSSMYEKLWFRKWK